MKAFCLLTVIGLFFGVATTVQAQVCHEGEYYKSIRTFPNGSVQIEEPGIYAAGALVEYFSFYSDAKMLCDLLGYPYSFGAHSMVVEEKAEKCIEVDSLGKISSTSVCDLKFKYLFCNGQK